MFYRCKNAFDNWSNFRRCCYNTISYSKKFEGLFGNLNYPFVISATRIDTDEAVQQTVRYINDKDVLSKAYGRMMPEINDKLENVKKQIKGIMMH